jgi:hypothetical protein
MNTRLEVRVGSPLLVLKKNPYHESGRDFSWGI